MTKKSFPSTHHKQTLKLFFLVFTCNNVLIADDKSRACNWVIKWLNVMSLDVDVMCFFSWFIIILIEIFNFLLLLHFFNFVFFFTICFCFFQFVFQLLSIRFKLPSIFAVISKLSQGWIQTDYSTQTTTSIYTKMNVVSVVLQKGWFEFA